MITVRIDEKHSSLLAVSFPEDTVANHLIREIPGRRWSYTRRCWLVPNTRAAVVQVGKLAGKDCCNFDEAIVRLYKPAVTPVGVERATNPPWPPINRRIAGTHRLSFRYAPRLGEFDKHPAIISLCNTLRIPAIIGS